jgi:hypothetical protein
MGILLMVKFIRGNNNMFKINIVNLVMFIITMVKFIMAKPTTAQLVMVKLIIMIKLIRAKLMVRLVMVDFNFNYFFMGSYP